MEIFKYIQKQREYHSKLLCIHHPDSKIRNSTASLVSSILTNQYYQIF